MRTDLFLLLLEEIKESFMFTCKIRDILVRRLTLETL